MCKAMGALPDSGGLLDQRADHYAFFCAFASAEAEDLHNRTHGG